MPQSPDRGRYTLASTPADYRRAAEALAHGRGPFAIDTERASAYRYDDRAFLVQVFRRGAGTFLLAPEGHRDAFPGILGPVLNGGDWIVHAAPEDLPSLAELGLYPGMLFDTALAGRIAGFDKPNLAAMVEEFCGVVLEKGHGRENWSEVPLPDEWLDYAAEDVIYLNELAEAQAELLASEGKLDIADEEFAFIVAEYAEWEPVRKTWRDLKGLSQLKTPTSLAVARAVWEERDTQARRRDISPSMIMPNKTVLALAKELPRTPQQLGAVHGFPRRRRGAVKAWFSVLQSVYDSDPAGYPDKSRRSDDAATAPGKSAWQRHHPESWEALQAMRSAVMYSAAELSIQPEVLITPATLRQAVWTATHTPGPWDAHRAAVLLRGLGAREWQIAEVAPLFGLLET
ncbi:MULTISPECIES: HRDC domain-containing protein [unclassified Corynebacterium]|uniref:HRDC domain-containing protein n=1 Tax=unclassified Corynebacterium TaxID=2624378 RepID=UPI0021AAF805|nr:MULTISPECIES: HRDC domain-containing protein [unclassified Corynebacterium]MCT1452287.1 HRDC domain-containing protein [Corynebacterium sp. p3-SID1145]MCT1461317.1 HRDC domain-containing protein [Corynebacterium sp. p3-SID1140]MDN8593819.1 HRDC domain-containing protein [Corynebacterium sp. P4_F2]WKK55927.1 HRDC domain-containing protein [Corynebacterium sp. P4-C1]WKK63337.1 HRDC domain-containing protein [Corynebacterium sp. P8-C1]